eukprot:TRINITY_DN95835_c0_g1_i1.p1 TRINITY_DN95835_c0_g1~~TRINITY_DN95835_c0_g1_i1.p1  ORF type:complete len:132 (+),score=13.25 TRINITY_DN95835_c0_g1_i1:53-448(+)
MSIFRAAAVLVVLSRSAAQPVAFMPIAEGKDCYTGQGADSACHDSHKSCTQTEEGEECYCISGTDGNQSMTLTECEEGCDAIRDCTHILHQGAGRGYCGFRKNVIAKECAAAAYIVYRQEYKLSYDQRYPW